MWFMFCKYFLDVDTHIGKREVNSVHVVYSALHVMTKLSAVKDLAERVILTGNVAQVPTYTQTHLQTSRMFIYAAYGAFTGRRFDKRQTDFGQEIRKHR